MSEQNEHMNFDGKVFNLLFHTLNQPLIFIGDKIAWSPVGPGELNECTEAGYPRVNHVAVTTLVNDRGIVFGDLRNQIEKDARKLNKLVSFSYFENGTYHLEGTGRWPSVKFGDRPIICDARDFLLEWKVSYVKQEKTEQEIKDEKRFQYGVEIATPGIECILNNKDLSDEQKKEQLIHHCANWIQSYSQESDNCKFYRELLVGIGMMFGDVAKTSDDGSVQEDVLVVKVPELVHAAVKNSNELKRLMNTIGSVTLSG